jgi:hypothetical protein
MHTRARCCLALLLVALVLSLAPSSASAHGGHNNPIQTFTQAIGPYEVAVTVEIPPAVPAPLNLSIVPPNDIGEATFQFRAAPRGQPFEGAQVAEVKTLPGPQGVYYAQLQADRVGDWDIEVQLESPAGSGVARIPFSIVIAPPPPYTVPLFAALGTLVVLMLSSIVLGLIFSRRGGTVPGWINQPLGYGIFGSAVVAAVFGFQQFNTTIQEAQARANNLPPPSVSASASYGRPHANVALRTEPTEPQAGEPLRLVFDLTDGSTGLPIDDVVTHHEALVHLVVLNEDGSYFQHVHPPRVAPGRYEIDLPTGAAGRYTAYVEIERLDSGTQLIARTFNVGGNAAAQTPPPEQGLGVRYFDGLQVSISASDETIQAGAQSTLMFSFSGEGGPTLDLQPWLGMGGHLLIRNEDDSLAHVHAAAEMAPPGIAGLGMRYGPDIRFVYTFPQPGRYQLWGQFKHNGEILTIPVALDVASGIAAGGEGER